MNDTSVDPQVMVPLHAQNQPLQVNDATLPAVEPAQQATTSIPQQPTVPVDVGTSPVSPTSPAAKNSAHSPEIAEDVDLIEKEWVVKAKAIVEGTKGNPNEQSKELNRFKADYLKKRYSKDLKVSES